MKKLHVAFVVLLSLSACHKDDASAALQGEYIEKTPAIGRSKMIFEGSDKVTIIKDITSGFTPDTNAFRYNIAGGNIQLVLLPDGVDSSSNISFTSLSNTSFETSNLYISIPEAPPVTILFTKQ